MTWLVCEVIRALYPGGDGFPSAEEVGLREFVARTRREAAPSFWLAVVLGACVYAATPLLTVHVPLPSFWLPRRWRERHAQRITAHPLYVLRQAVLMPKVLGALCWGQSAAVRARLALEPYPPDPGTWRRT